MGQDYSYTQPSSSECDMIHILEEEDALYADEADSRYAIADAYEYSPQPEADEGVPRTCYCGAEPSVDTSYTRKDPGRRYYTCVNADDGDCHIWKWWDVAVMEEMRELERQLRMLKDQFFESDQKVAKLEKILCSLTKKKAEAKYGLAKDTGKEKRKQVVDLDVDDEVPEPEARPIGVKGAKAAGKRKKSGREEEMDKLEAVMEKKEKLYNQKILDRLLAKKVPLSEMEETLKLKLMSGMI